MGGGAIASERGGGLLSIVQGKIPTDSVLKDLQVNALFRGRGRGIKYMVGFRLTSKDKYAWGILLI
jgi:hypothetical protein